MSNLPLCSEAGRKSGESKVFISSLNTSSVFPFLKLIKTVSVHKIHTFTENYTSINQSKKETYTIRFWFLVE